MKIAILAWGSLIWDQRNLVLAGDWQRAGPELSIEFSRISNDGRLTLVIDERHGVPIPTRYALSGCPDLKSAIANLQAREGTPSPEGIGYVDLGHGRESQRARAGHPRACAAILDWGKKQELDAVIWTAIGPRFKERANEDFSVEAAIRYLSGLRDPTRALALNYIRNAPEEVATPVRTKAKELPLS